jgi:alkylation response protein AidB-like acyl-CoA dehydrogenase
VAAGDLDSLEASVSDGAVTGEKYGVLNADQAPFGVVVGRSSTGLAAGVVEGGSYEVLAPEDKMGLEAAPTSVVRFDGACDQLRSGPDLERAVLWAKLATGAVALGCARASLEYSSVYATEREAFGKPIGAFQAVSFKVADMAIIVDSARTALWRAAWRLEQEEATASDVAEANGQALTAAIRCGDDGVQVLGGHGYIQDHPVEMWFRDAVTLSVFDAPDLLGDLTVARSIVA